MGRKPQSLNFTWYNSSSSIKFQVNYIIPIFRASIGGLGKRIPSFKKTKTKTNQLNCSIFPECSPVGAMGIQYDPAMVGQDSASIM
jgi:hypothetical protein